MKLFLDDFSVYSYITSHLDKLQLCFEKYQESDINLNLKKCSLLVYLDIILAYEVSKRSNFFIQNKSRK